MFEQVNANQNNIINLLKVPEKGNSDIQSKSSGTDFFAMVMEKTGYDDKARQSESKLNQVAEPQKNSEKSEPVKNDQNITSADNSRVSVKRDREENTSDKEKNVSKESDNKEIKNETKHDSKDKEVKAVGDSTVKDVKVKKHNGKEPVEETDIINQLHGENNIKNLMEIIKAALNGNKKAEEEGFQKLFSNLKPKQDKENINSKYLFIKNDTSKNQKASPEIFNFITKELKETISKELSKNIENKKSGSKPQIINDKELKELASNIIDSIKKNKAKDIVRHETRIASGDDHKSDKKPALTIDPQPLKKMEISEDSSFDKNGTKDKNHGKDNLSYNGTKIDFSGKSGMEKMEHALKMSDFRESLQEVIDKAKVTVKDSRNGAFTIRLNPQELGNVNVNLIMENGVITGKFLVDSEEVKSMLLSSLNDLKYQLEEAGISFGDFSVSVNDQREKYLKQKDDESLKSLSFLNTDRDIIAAADQYDSTTAAHTGHINMVI